MINFKVIQSLFQDQKTSMLWKVDSWDAFTTM